MLKDSRRLAALAAVGLWSTNAYVAGRALEQMSVEWLLGVQFGVAALVFGILRLTQTRRAPSAQRPWPGLGALALSVIGLSGTIFLQYLAFALAPIVAANVLAYAWPLLAAVFIAVTRRTAAAGAGAALAVLGFAGVGLIFLGPGRDTTAAATAPAWGYAAALGSALCMTIYTLGSGRTSATVTGLLLPATTIGAAVAGVLIGIGEDSTPSIDALAAAAYLGLGPMAAGYGLWTHAMSGTGATRLAPLGYATPMLSTLLLLATGATATTLTIAGIGLVLVCSLGVLAIDRPSTTSAARDRPPVGSRKDWG
ncbi:MAG: DMT family transporter [Nocardioidaceae bacterium]